MAEVIIRLEGGLLLGNEGGLNARELEKLGELAQRFSKQLGAAAAFIVGPTVHADKKRKRRYLFGAGPGTEISTRGLDNPVNAAIFRLLSGLAASPEGYGVKAFPKAFYSALYELLEDKDVEWEYTSTIVGYGDGYTSFRVALRPGGLEGSWEEYVWNESTNEYVEGSSQLTDDTIDQILSDNRTDIHPGNDDIIALLEESDQSASDDEKTQLTAAAIVADALDKSGCEFSAFGDIETGVFLIEALQDGTPVDFVSVEVKTVDGDSLIQIQCANNQRPTIPARKAPAMAAKICILNETLPSGAFSLSRCAGGYAAGYREIIYMGTTPPDSALLAETIDCAFRTFSQHEESLFGGETN